MSYWRKVTLLSFFGFLVTFLMFLVNLTDLFYKNWGGDFRSEIPIIIISLKDVSLDEIINNDKSIKYEGNQLTLITDNSREYFTDVQIKGRGNSTWGLPKAPFQIKFNTKVDLLGLGARKKYILLANYIDVSNLRNDLMFKLSEMIGEKYRARGEFVELFIDDEYQGLYNLVSKIEISKHGVDLRNERGVLMEIDTLHQSTEDCNYSGFSECVIVKDAVFEDDEERLALSIEDFMNSFNGLEILAKEGDFGQIKELIDLESFAYYFIISEFSNNPDSYISSFNFYKDGPEDKIHAGPLWDLDYAFSNRDWFWGYDDRFFSPYEYMVQREWIEDSETETGKLMYYLSDIPEFQGEVRRVWEEKMSGRKSELMTYLDQRFEYIKKAALLNEEKWFGEARFLDEFEYLRDWLDKRFDFFEQKYGESTPL